MAHAGAISALEDQFLDDWVPSDEEILLEQEKCYQILDLLTELGAAQLDQPAIWAHQEPIWIATISGHQDLLRKVVSHGANVNAQWQLSKLPMWTVLHEGLCPPEFTPETVSLLLDYGTSPCIGHRLRSTPLSILILKQKKFLWGSKEWAIAQCMLKHERPGPAITAKYTAGMMAMFLSQAIISAGAFELSERLVSFAKLTNVRGRWGPGGISGIRELTHRPEYWREPWLRIGGLPVARRKLIMASKLVDKLCPGRGKADWFLKDLEPKTTARPKSGPMSDEDLLSAFELLFSE